MTDHINLLSPLPVEYWSGKGPADVSRWARTATHAEEQKTHTVVMYGYDLEGVHTRWIGIDIKPQGNELYKGKFKLWLLRYIIDGTGTLESPSNPNTVYTIEPGMVVWTAPEVQTIQRVTSKKPLRAFTAMMFGRDMDKRFSQAFSSNFGCRTVSEPVMIESLFGELFLESQFRNINRNQNCADLSSILLNRVATHLKLSDNFAGEARLYYQQAQSYIESNYATMGSALEAAEHCGISRQYLARIFKEFAGVSPHQYIANLKMYLARQHLSTTDAAISEVAAAVGYEDQALFSRNFRKFTGESPREFRNRFRDD